VRLPTFVSRLLACLALATGGVATANCSRPMQVPMSSTGQSVIISDGEISGIYPELLRSLGGKDGCEFVLTPVPRARQELLFETGKADLLVPATKTQRRDEHGIFVPLTRSRATLISLDGKRAPFKSAYDLIERKDVRVVLVRGFDYGVAYQELTEALQRQNRLVLESDPLAVARVLKANPGDVTIMAPVILVGAIQDDARVSDMVDKLRFDPIAELPWGDNGLYISKNSLSKEDSATLLALLNRPTVASTLWKSFQTYYPANVLKESIRPRDSK
jgi:polar amino acid transport system substrate-binding protein